MKLKLLDDSVAWNPFNKVVQSHRTGEIDLEKTNQEREKRHLPVPWTRQLGNRELLEPPVY